MLDRCELGLGRGRWRVEYNADELQRTCANGPGAVTATEGLEACNVRSAQRVAALLGSCCVFVVGHMLKGEEDGQLEERGKGREMSI